MDHPHLGSIDDPTRPSTRGGTIARLETVRRIISESDESVVSHCIAGELESEIPALVARLAAFDSGRKAFATWETAQEHQAAGRFDRACIAYVAAGAPHMAAEMAQLA